MQNTTTALLTDSVKIFVCLRGYHIVNVATIQLNQ